MNKNDHIKLARIIRENSKSEYDGFMGELPIRHIDRDKFVDALCDILKSDNPNFDKDGFLEELK